MKLGRLVGNVLALLAVAAGHSEAAELAEPAFTNSFDDITSGASVSLTWDGIAPQHYPLCVTAQVIERGGDGYKANSYRVNITTGASDSSYEWTGVPYPLRWIKSGLYQLELRPMSWPGGDPPLLAKSPVFGISEPVGVAGPASSASPQSTVVDDKGDDTSGMSKPMAIGVGVAIGIPSIVVLAFVGRCFRKRQRRVAMEKRRLKRHEFVIH